MFPLKDETLALYPPLVGIGERYGPTQVHLQVYDGVHSTNGQVRTWVNLLIDTAHVLPILFPFTTPGKYCYRAIATFTKHVTGMLPQMDLTPSSSEVIAPAPYHPTNADHPSGTSIQQISRLFLSDVVTESPRTLDGSHSTPDSPAPTSDSSNLRSSFSRPAFFSFGMKSVRASISRSISEQSLRRGESSSSRSQEGRNVGSPGKMRRSVSMIDTTEIRYAGEASIYYNQEVSAVPRIVACICTMS